MKILDTIFVVSSLYTVISIIGLVVWSWLCDRDNRYTNSEHVALFCMFTWVPGCIVVVLSWFLKLLVIVWSAA